MLEQIRTGDERILKSLYDNYRPEFLAWAIQRYRCEEELAGEVYQQAYTLMYFNIKDGKLKTLTSSLKTYLFGIGKNLFRERGRAAIRPIQSIEESPNLGGFDTDILDQYTHEHQKEVVRILLKEIGNPCKRLLELFFYRNYSTEAVAHTMDYKDERVVRKRKSICLKQLRTLYQQYKSS